MGVENSMLEEHQLGQVCPPSSCPHPCRGIRVRHHLHLLRQGILTSEKTGLNQICGASLWNSSPQDMMMAPGLDAFKKERTE